MTCFLARDNKRNYIGVSSDEFVLTPFDYNSCETRRHPHMKNSRIESRQVCTDLLSRYPTKSPLRYFLSGRPGLDLAVSFGPRFRARGRGLLDDLARSFLKGAVLAGAHEPLSVCLTKLQICGPSAMTAAWAAVKLR